VRQRSARPGPLLWERGRHPRPHRPAIRLARLQPSPGHGDALAAIHTSASWTLNSSFTVPCYHASEKKSDSLHGRGLEGEG
jgi:hypothetical protein